MDSNAPKSKIVTVFGNSYLCIAMISVWRIQLWVEYLERENEARLGGLLCESGMPPGKAEELLDILKISRYKELGLSLKDLHLILRHLTVNLPFEEVTLIKLPGRIYSIPGSNNYQEFTINLSAAKKCARHGYDVYMLPNPNEGKSPDFILVKNGKYYAYELKTIYSAASIWERMASALQQSDRIMLDMVDTPSSRYLTYQLKSFVVTYNDVIDIMIFKGNKELHVTSQMAKSSSFVERFMKLWNK